VIVKAKAGLAAMTPATRAAMRNRPACMKILLAAGVVE
jgi:hypothetical protein